jgi:hypothetical protein
VERQCFSRFIWFAAQLYLLLIARCNFLLQVGLDRGPGGKICFAIAPTIPAQIYFRKPASLMWLVARARF